MSNALVEHDLPEEVKSVKVKEQKVFDGLSFPLILSPSDDFLEKESEFWNEWIKKNIKVIESLLLKYGAILFRGFPFDTSSEFDQFSKACGYDPFSNVSGLGVRTKVVGNVYLATETPPDLVIPFHHEMAHMPEYPLIIFFYCDIPAKEGGNTPIALSSVVYRKMTERDPDFVDRLKREGLRYLWVASNGRDPSVSYGRSWQSLFSTSDKEEAERKAKAMGYDVEWLEDGSMKTLTKVLPAIRVDQRTGKTMWFNSIFTIFFLSTDPKNFSAVFPNFETTSEDKIETLKQVYEESGVSLKWHQKDVLMVDNRSVEHCKDKYHESPRRILSSLFSDHQGPI